MEDRRGKREMGRSRPLPLAWATLQFLPGSPRGTNGHGRGLAAHGDMRTVAQIAKTVLFSTVCPQAHRRPSSQPRLPTQKGTDGGRRRHGSPARTGWEAEAKWSPGKLTRKPESGERAGRKEADTGNELVQAGREKQKGREVKEEATNGMETG